MHFHLNTHQQHPHKKLWQKIQKNKNREAQTFRHANRSRQGTQMNAYTHTYLPDTQHILTDKHTKKQQTQRTAQPEVYFMQKYSKVCFTIQLNIKGWYIPLWYLTPQWTNPTHPNPLTVYTESCWTSPLIIRQRQKKTLHHYAKTRTYSNICIQSTVNHSRTVLFTWDYYFLGFLGNCSSYEDTQKELLRQRSTWVNIANVHNSWDNERGSFQKEYTNTRSGWALHFSLVFLKCAKM